MAKPLDWISLTTLDTGFTFASTHSLSIFDRWDWIEECVREQLECFADDDVNLDEDEDGREFVTVNGKPVAEIHHRYVRNPSFVGAVERVAA